MPHLSEDSTQALNRLGLAEGTSRVLAGHRLGCWSKGTRTPVQLRSTSDEPKPHSCNMLHLSEHSAQALDGLGLAEGYLLAGHRHETSNSTSTTPT
jgi:hypothetical protein